jgi:transposase
LTQNADNASWLRSTFRVASNYSLRWQCHDCDTIHDRDINAALNILKRGEFELTQIQNKKLSKGIDLT